MKDLIEKYYVFTLVFVVLSIALIVFRGNDTIVNVIIGAFVGLIAAPAVYPKQSSDTK